MNRYLARQSSNGFKRTGQHGVVSELGTAILRGEFPVGANLPNEAELTARFAVSRTVIREVMKTLAAKGLIVAKTKVGTRVSDRANWNLFDTDVLTWRVRAGIDAAFLKSLFELRSAVEPASAALAAERQTDADLAELRTILDDMAAPGHTTESFSAVDLAFHMAIAKASGNPFMLSISGIIEAAINATFTVQSPVQNAVRQRAIVATHSAVADAIEARDARAARRAMIEVIEDGIADRGGDPRDLPT